MLGCSRYWQTQSPPQSCGIPAVSRFIARDVELRELDQHLLNTQHAVSRRKIAVAQYLGGVGKTQLAIEFARKHTGSLSGIFWRDGSSEASLKQSFVEVAKRLPRDELTAEGVEMVKQHAADVDVAVRVYLRPVSQPSLQTHGSGGKVVIVGTEQACAILKVNAGRVVEVK